MADEESAEELEDILEAEEEELEETEEFLEENVEATGHAGYKITYKGKVIYIDPYDISDAEEADIVVITHYHFDHASYEALEQIVGKDTVIITPDFSALSWDDLDVIDPEFVMYIFRNAYSPFNFLSPGQSIDIGDIGITAVHSYNKKASEHPKGKGNGYVIKLGDKRIYHAGDSECIPEMGSLPKIDIALLPVAGPGKMSPKEAADCVKLIKPTIAMPMHYGCVGDVCIGNWSDAATFKSLVDYSSLKTKVVLD